MRHAHYACALAFALLTLCKVQAAQSTLSIDIVWVGEMTKSYSQQRLLIGYFAADKSRSQVVTSTLPTIPTRSVFEASRKLPKECYHIKVSWYFRYPCGTGRFVTPGYNGKTVELLPRYKKNEQLTKLTLSLNHAKPSDSEMTATYTPVNEKLWVTICDGASNSRDNKWIGRK